MNQTIHWRQIWSLIALNASIIISWIAYHNYQPKLLEQFNYLHYEGFLQKAKLLILLVIPPLAGFLADRFFKPGDRRVPLVTAGVSFTALVFMLVASAIGNNPIFDLSAYLPIMIVVWLISMNVFYAPALAMLEKFVPIAQFAIVMGIFILVSDIIYSLEPAIVFLVDFFGAPFTFLFGGVIVLGSGLWFSKAYKSWNSNEKEAITENSIPVHTIKPIKIWIIAFLFGIALAFLINVLPGQLESKLIRADLGKYTGEVIVSGLLFLTALAAWALSKRVTVDNIASTFVVSFISIIILFFVSAFLENGAALFPLLLVIPMLGLLSVSAFPMAMSNAGLKHKMLAAGLFISGAEFPDSFLEMFF
jgi:MFS family permease